MARDENENKQIDNLGKKNGSSGGNHILIQDCQIKKISYWHFDKGWERINKISLIIVILCFFGLFFNHWLGWFNKIMFSIVYTLVLLAPVALIFDNDTNFFKKRFRNSKSAHFRWIYPFLSILILTILITISVVAPCRIVSKWEGSSKYSRKSGLFLHFNFYIRNGDTMKYCSKQWAYPWEFVMALPPLEEYYPVTIRSHKNIIVVKYFVEYDEVMSKEFADSFVRKSPSQIKNEIKRQMISIIRQKLNTQALPEELRMIERPYNTKLLSFYGSNSYKLKINDQKESLKSVLGAGNISGINVLAIEFPTP